MTAIATATRTIRRIDLDLAVAGIDGQHFTGDTNLGPPYTSTVTPVAQLTVVTETDIHNVRWGSNRVAPNPTGPGLPLAATPPLPTQASRDRPAANYGNNQAAYVNPNGLANRAANSTGSGGFETTPPTVYGA